MTKHKLKDNYEVSVLCSLSLVVLCVGLFYFTGESINVHEIHESKLYDMSYKKYEGERYVNSVYKPEDNWELQKNKKYRWDVQINKRYGWDAQIYEVDRFRNEPLRNMYLENAWSIYNRTYEAVEEEGWFNKTKAKNDGFYVPRWAGNHYIKDKFWEDNMTMDPERPEFLMYGGEGNDKLIGVMYMLDAVEKEGQQFAGPIVKWHYHTYYKKKCFSNGFPDHGKRLGKCPDKLVSHSSPEMFHVWFIDHPEGVFATPMSVGRQGSKSSNEKMKKEEFYEKVKEDDYDQ